MTAYATQFVRASSQYERKASGVTGLPTSTGSREVGFWYTASSLPTAGNDHWLFSYGTNSAGNMFGINLSYSSGNYVLQVSNFSAAAASSAMVLTTGVKYYFGISYDGTNVTFLLNNMVLNTTAISGMNTTLTLLMIGAYPDGTSGYSDCAMYDMRLYNKTLSAAERKSNAAGQTTTTGIVFRGCIDNTTNDATGTNNCTASTSAPTYTTSSTYVPVTTLGITGFSQSGSPLLTGLRAYYKATDLTDASGNGYTLTNNNSATVNPTGGKVDGAFDFGSANTNKSMTIANQLGLAKNDARSYLWWVQITTAPTSGNIGVMLATEYTTGAVGYSMDYWNSSGTLKTRTGRFKDTINDPTLIVTETFTTATWVQCAYTFDGTTEFFYVGGVLVGTNAPGTADGTGTALPNEFSIGKNAYGRYLSGLMSAIAAHSRTVSYDEILAYYNNGAGIPWSATITGNPRRRMLIFMPS